MNFSSQLKLKDWTWRTSITNILNLEENIYACKKNYLWRKKRFEKLMYEIYTRWEKWRELKKYESTNSLCKKKKKRDNTKSHFTNAGNARADESYEWLRRFSRCWIKLQWQIVLRLQSACNDSKFLFHAEPRQTLANWYMEYVWTTGRRFW